MHHRTGPRNKSALAPTHVPGILGPSSPNLYFKDILHPHLCLIWTGCNKVAEIHVALISNQVGSGTYFLSLLTALSCTVSWVSRCCLRFFLWRTTIHVVPCCAKMMDYSCLVPILRHRAHSSEPNFQCAFSQAAKLWTVACRTDRAHDLG